MTAEAAVDCEQNPDSTSLTHDSSTGKLLADVNVPERHDEELTVDTVPNDVLTAPTYDTCTAWLVGCDILSSETREKDELTASFHTLLDNGDDNVLQETYVSGARMNATPTAVFTALLPMADTDCFISDTLVLLDVKVQGMLNPLQVYVDADVGDDLTVVCNEL